MAKRGRPPNNGFALLDQIPEKDLPQYVPRRRQAGSGSSEINQELINSIKELIKDYRKNLGQGKFISDELILLYSEIGGEHLTPEDNAFIKKLYEAAVAKGKMHQTRGTTGIKEKARDRAKAVWGKQENKYLVSRVKAGVLPLNRAITIIFSDWGARGDGEVKPPSPKTLSNLYYTIYPKK